MAVASVVLVGGNDCARWLRVGETEEGGGRAASEGEDRGATGHLQALEWGRGGSRRWLRLGCARTMRNASRREEDDARRGGLGLTGQLL